MEIVCGAPTVNDSVLTATTLLQLLVQWTMSTLLHTLADLAVLPGISFMRAWDSFAIFMYTSGSGHTKPFFLGKSFGLLKVINID